MKERGGGGGGGRRGGGEKESASRNVSNLTFADLPIRTCSLMTIQCLAGS